MRCFRTLAGLWYTKAALIHGRLRPRGVLCFVCLAAVANTTKAEICTTLTMFFIAWVMDALGSAQNNAIDDCIRREETLPAYRTAQRFARAEVFSSRKSSD